MYYSKTLATVFLWNENWARKCRLELFNLTTKLLHSSYIPGTAGTELSDDPDLYISRDGGVSWEKTLDGSWGVSVLDHGGLMVAARDYHQLLSNEIMYTCNEGISWQSFVFGDANMVVFGVITEPGEHTTVVRLGPVIFLFTCTLPYCFTTTFPTTDALPAPLFRHRCPCIVSMASIT